jgi:hypothetical protein
MFSAPLRAPPVSRLVDDDSQQPRSQRPRSVKVSERRVRFHERLLRCVLRVCGVAGDEVGGAERWLLMARDDDLVGADVPALRALHQLGVVLWPAHHCGAYTVQVIAVPADCRGRNSAIARSASRDPTVGGAA